MDFKQLRSFVAVADCGSFTQAAAKLYASQPTVSAHIRQLEDELHETLFLRTTKSLAITPRGRELYDYAVHVLDLQEQLIAAAAAFPELDAPKKTRKLDAQTKKSLAVFQRLTGSAPTGTPDAQSASDLAGMQFLLQHAQSTRFVQFPGITLKSGMQDREVRIV